MSRLAGEFMDTISIVDDDPSVRSATVDLLNSLGFACEAYGSAAEYLGAMRAPDTCCLILDINMPGMTGLEMLPKVKAERPNVPVIMITAYGDEATRTRAAELGAAGLLPKPVDFGLLRREIDQRLEGAT